MDRHDVIVVGAGISGLAFAWKAAQAGRKALVLEREDRVGGCIHSVRREDGYWYELGAHTVYNSYGAFLDIAVGTGVSKDIVERGPARSHFGLMRDGQYKWLTPPKILLQLNWLEAAVSAPFGFFRSKEGQTVKSYYGSLIGRRNYERLFGPFFAAVPSQSADGFPVDGPGSLFKKRPRREEFIRSFGFKGGLGALCDAAARAGNVTTETGVTVRKISRGGAGYVVETADGRRLEAEIVAVAVPPNVAAELLGVDFPEVRRQLERVKTV
ncbi:MAG TPA: FAD-dependent oxidoreductase, partial [Anaeromyxobacteraceae bacterium]|nr:FAD-dependent oxidoreductase [Anaeromyxobacteraceae bacterium]